LQLQYFNGSAWVPVVSSGGVAPQKDTTDNLDGTVSGGRFAVTFDTTSSPSLGALSGTVFTAATPAEPAEIAISWRHLRRHGWTEALHTLLHEMVHQWQDEQGFAIDHGSSFRAKAREVGITPSARRRPTTGQQTRLEA